MLFPGQRVKYYSRDAIVLVCSGNEVLLYIDERTIKWVDKALFELLQTA